MKVEFEIPEEYHNFIKKAYDVYLANYKRKIAAWKKYGVKIGDEWEKKIPTLEEFIFELMKEGLDGFAYGNNLGREFDELPD